MGGVEAIRAKNHQLGVLHILCGTLLFLVIVGLGSYQSGRPLLWYGGAHAVYDGAHSLWQYGSLSASSFGELHTELLRRSHRCDCGIWQDVYGITSAGEHIPARGLLLTLLSAPLIGTMGPIGAWLANSLVFIWVVLAFFSLSRRLASSEAALVATVVLIFGVRLYGYSFGLHYDLFGLALIIGGIAALTSIPALGGLLVALSAETRPTNLLFLLLVPIAAYFAWGAAGIRDPKLTRKRTFKAVLGMLVGLTALAWLHQHLWGGALTTGYHRLIGYESGAVRLPQPNVYLDLSELTKDWWRKFFSFESGVITRNPAVVLGVFGLLMHPKAFPLLIPVLLLVTSAHGIFFFSSPAWEMQERTHRYLMPNMVLLCLGLGPFLKGIASILQTIAQGSSK